MVELLIASVLVALFLFASVLLFGAPYLPTLSKQVNTAITMINLKPGQTLLELGCGDGRVVIAAAEKGLNVVGYELNPLLACIAWVRTRKYKGRVRIVWGNFWNRQLPEADAIFVFLLDKYMNKLDKKITQTYSGKSIKLVSFAFKIPRKVVKKEAQGLFLYQY